METEFTKIGILGKSFGTEGFNKLKVFNEFGEIVKKSDFLFIKVDNYYVPYRVEAFKPGKRMIKFDDVETQQSADKLHNQSLYLHTSVVGHLLVNELEAWIGYTVFSDDKSIGKIIDIREMPHQLLATVSYQNKEIYLPIHEDLIVEIVPEEKMIALDLPEGILDL